MASVLIAAGVAIVLAIVLNAAVGQAGSGPSASTVAASVVGDQATDGTTAKSDFATGVVTTDSAGDATVPVQLTFSDGTRYDGTATLYADGSNAFTTTGYGY